MIFAYKFDWGVEREGRREGEGKKGKIYHFGNMSLLFAFI